MGTHTCALNVDEVNIVSGGMNHCPKSHGVCHLSMEPDVLIGGEQPGELGPDDADNVAQHGNEDHPPVESEYKSRSARAPHRELKTVEGSQFLIGRLSIVQSKSQTGAVSTCRSD